MLCPSKTELVLSPHEVQVDDRYSGFAGPGGEHRFTLPALAPVIRGAIDVDEYVGAVGRLERRRPIGYPDVFTHRDTNDDPVDLPQRTGVTAHRKVSILIENPVVGQATLVIDPAHPPTLDEGRGVVDADVACIVRG